MHINASSHQMHHLITPPLPPSLHRKSVLTLLKGLSTKHPHHTARNNTVTNVTNHSSSHNNNNNNNNSHLQKNTNLNNNTATNNNAANNNNNANLQAWRYKVVTVVFLLASFATALRFPDLGAPYLPNTTHPIPFQPFHV